MDNASSIGRRLAAILAADIAGYSRLMGQDEAATVRDLKGHQAVILPLVGRHGGRIIDTAGDGVLAEFPSVIGATECAVDMQAVMAARNEDVPEHRRMRFRIGINLGDVIHDESRIYGDGINVAARLEALAPPGGVLVSQAVHDQVRDRLDLAFEDLGEHELKNIVRPVHVYRIRTPAEPDAAGAVGPALPLPDKPSIAVLPFLNLSGDPEHGYLADGIAEDILTGLSRLRWLFVIARNSSFTYKGRHVDVRQVGRELGVRYVLEGSVRKGGHRIRVTGQLIEAATGAHLWAERYDRALDDVFAIQDEITGSVIGCIQPEVYAAEHDRLRRKPPQRLDAWESFVRGMFLYSQHSDASTKEALGVLDRAIELDPGYAQAHGLRAVCLAWRAFQGWEDRDRAFAAAARGADHAVACDPQEPWGHLAQGFLAVGNRRDADAVAAFRRAIDASPNFAYAHGLLGAAHAFGGRPDQAIECIDRGVRLSPRDTFGDEYQLYYAFAHFQAGRYAEAAAAAGLAIQLRPGHPVLYIMAAASHGLAGEIDQAQRAVSQLTALVPTLSAAAVEETFLYVQGEDRERLARSLRVGGLPG
jgi:TolB-like protein/class 3 adenylate cyclase/tetratricopeptide (TPR) repeat protein